jgi:moderate conductance mechanosensitive channel
VLEPALAALLTGLASLLVTVALLVVGYRLLLRAMARVARPGRDETELSVRVQRARTLGSLVTNVARWIAAFIVLVVALRELGVDVRAILVSAGVVGFAVGFGAQTLIRDLITGVFLLFEGLVAVGDVVQVGPHAGTVEAVGLRVTRLRMPDGGLRVVPNGQLGDFTNYSRGPVLATIDVAVPRDTPLDRALAVLTETGEAWAAATGAALERPATQGIIKVTGADVVLRLMVKVSPARRPAAEAELRRRIKEAFDREPWSFSTP